MSKANTKKSIDMPSDSEEEEVAIKPSKKRKEKGVNKKEEKEIEGEEVKLLNQKQKRKEANDKGISNKKKKVDKKGGESEEDVQEEVKPKKKAKKPSKEESDNESDDNEDEEVKPKKKAELKKKPITKGKKDKDKEKEEEEEEEEETKEPELVKKDPEETEPIKTQKKTFSPGTCNELFIKNLSYNTTQEGLADFFQKYGAIEETKIVYDKITQRSKGVGFCRFYDYESAARAMEDAGQLTLDGRPIAISYSNDKPAMSKAKVAEFKSDSNFQGERFGVFVGNLSFKSNEKGIESFFKDCGKIVDIRIAKTPEGKLRGFAHVDLDSKESVDKALKKSGQQLDGREIRIDKSEQKPKPSGYNAKSLFGDRRNNFKGGKPFDSMGKARTSGAMISTESKSKEIVDSEEDA